MQHSTKNVFLKERKKHKVAGVQKFWHRPGEYFVHVHVLQPFSHTCILNVLCILGRIHLLNMAMYM